MMVTPHVGNGSGAVSPGEEIRLHYPRIAAHLDAILQDLPQAETDAAWQVGQKNGPAVFSTLAFVTIFQFIEGLSDTQAIAASRQRADWRAALQLGPRFPGFNRRQLCPFRRGFYDDPAQAAYLDKLSQNLAQTGCLSQSLEVSGREMVEHVCLLNRMEWASEAMLRALEALAASQAVWLRGAALPHWFLRYTRAHLRATVAPTRPQLEANLRRVGADSYHLLFCMTPPAPTDPLTQATLGELEPIWNQHFVLREGEVVLKDFSCA